MPRKELKQEDVHDALDFFEDEVTEKLPEKKRVIGRPFQPGQSGNPSGHTAEAEGLDANLTLALGKAGAKRLARALIGIALEGSGHVQLSAIQYIYDRLEGRPRPIQRDDSTDDEPIITILHKLVNDNSALQGRPLPAQLGPIVEGEVREHPGTGTGS